MGVPAGRELRHFNGEDNPTNAQQPLERCGRVVPPNTPFAVTRGAGSVRFVLGRPACSKAGAAAGGSGSGGGRGRRATKVKQCPAGRAGTTRKGDGEME